MTEKHSHTYNHKPPPNTVQARYYAPKVSIFVNIEITKFLILSLIMEKIRKLNPVK